MNTRHREPCYGDYLQLDTLLHAQQPLKGEAHDEMLFIIVHQAYELWFKQILHELVSVQWMFDSERISDQTLAVADARLARINAIQQLLIDQIGVLETMTPLDFLDFRDALTPASGVQSLQFREIELRLGLYRPEVNPVERCAFFGRLDDADRNHLQQLAELPSLFDLVERWLTRMPFLHYGDFDFWRDYLKATAAMLVRDREILEAQTDLSDAERVAQAQQLEQNRIRFDGLFDVARYETMRREGVVRLGQEAMLAALFIHLYRDEPILHLPFLLLTRLVEIDERLATWRYRHLMMVQRMLGGRIGTGGSAGHLYLKRTLDNCRIFEDLFNLSTFLMPRSQRPILPENLRRDLGFHFNGF